MIKCCLWYLNVVDGQLEKSTFNIFFSFFLLLQWIEDQVLMPSVASALIWAASAATKLCKQDWILGCKRDLHKEKLLSFEII